MPLLDYQLCQLDHIKKCLDVDFCCWVSPCKIKDCALMGILEVKITDCICGLTKANSIIFLPRTKNLPLLLQQQNQHPVEHVLCPFSFCPPWRPSFQRTCHLKSRFLISHECGLQQRQRQHDIQLDVKVFLMTSRWHASNIPQVHICKHS